MNRSNVRNLMTLGGMLVALVVLAWPGSAAARGGFAFGFHRAPRHQRVGFKRHRFSTHRLGHRHQRHAFNFRHSLSRHRFHRGHQFKFKHGHDFRLVLPMGHGHRLHHGGIHHGGKDVIFRR